MLYALKVSIMYSRETKKIPTKLVVRKMQLNSKVIVTICTVGAKSIVYLWVWTSTSVIYYTTYTRNKEPITYLQLLVLYFAIPPR